MIRTLTAVGEYWLSDQTRAADVQMQIGKSYLELWGSACPLRRREDVQRMAEPAPRDKRFQDPEWKTNQFFDFVMQAIC